MKKRFAIAAAFAAGIVATGAFGAIRAVTPTAWDGRPDCWQMTRHKLRMEAVTNGGARVVFIGDSITHFWEDAGARVWKKYFETGSRRALQLGTSGDRTEHVLWRITEGRELDGYEAKCILLMIGTNNTGHFPIAKEPPIDTILGIREILNVIKQKQPGARTILTAIFPRGKADSPSRRRNDVVNREIAKFADGKSVIWCDFTDKFLDAEGRLSREIFPDLLHPNELGYEIWASSVVPLVDKVLAAQPDEHIPSVWPSSPRLYDCGDDPIPAMSLRGGNYWPARYLEKRNEIVDNGEIEYDAVFVGDSITHRWEREGGEGRELFAELKKTYRLLNLGYGGDRTQHVLWRMRNGELEGYKAKLFMLLIGVNNQGRDVPGIATGIKRILETIKAKHPESKILLLPIFPYREKPDDRLRMANESVNKIIKNYADGDTVLWVDFNDKFLEPGGILTRRVMNDLLHPNETGYKIWWENVQPYFKKIIGK
ncbi:MAG: hypothetical protein J6T01_06935 [Kiritimatiellae bacterium]|nr:hypothetical protein [Kiritimatiellia bacterium]